MKSGFNKLVAAAGAAALVNLAGCYEQPPCSADQERVEYKGTVTQDNTGSNFTSFKEVVCVDPNTPPLSSSDTVVEYMPQAPEVAQITLYSADGSNDVTMNAQSVDAQYKDFSAQGVDPFTAMTIDGLDTDMIGDTQIYNVTLKGTAQGSDYSALTPIFGDAKSLLIPGPTGVVITGNVDSVKFTGPTAPTQ